MPILEMFPAFAAYAVTATILCLNLLLVWNASGGVRAKTKTTPNDEDAKTFGVRVTEDESTSLARAMRIHRNATANVVPFLFLALIYVLLGAPANVAWGLFGAFTVARILHSVVYALGAQPWRTISYVVSQLVIVGVMIQIVRAIA